MIVVDQPVKLGWRQGALYLEIQPTQSQADELEQTGRMTGIPVPGLRDRLLEMVAGPADRIDWALVERAARERSGVPVRVTR